MGHNDDQSKSGRTSYITIPVADLCADKKLPAPIYIFLNQRMVKYRNKNDVLDATLLNKLFLNHISFIFIEDSSKVQFEDWIKETAQSEKEVSEPVPEEANEIAVAVEDQRRAVMDIFTIAREEPQIKVALEASKKIVTEFLKKPYVINNISALQKYSKGSVDHSVNVSTLSVFLGMRMGYTHQLILENLAMGGLFHDIGKVLIKKENANFNEDEDEKLLRKHPIFGANFMKTMKDRFKDKITNEVVMIVAQHHEYMDGSGYPDGLKATQIYDLSRIVTIANTYDNLISESKLENIKDRCFEALGKLEKEFEGKLEPRKLEKAVKILKYSLN